MGNSFRFKAGRNADGSIVHVRQDIWLACKGMVGRDHSLHGRMRFAEFVGETRARVTFVNAKGKIVTRVLEWDSVRWSNLRNEDVASEPERRLLWEAAHRAAIAELPQGTDERVRDAVVKSDPPEDQDAAHHRGFHKFGGCRT